MNENKNLGNWLAQLNHKRVECIYQVDYTGEERHNDHYYPWLFFITFEGFDQFLELEGDFDGDHIRISFYPLSELAGKIEENSLENIDLWKVYATEPGETLDKLQQKSILKIEYGVDKDVFEINGTSIQGQKDIFTFIRFYVNDAVISIFEGGMGLYVSDNPNVELNFPETFDTYTTA